MTTAHPTIVQILMLGEANVLHPLDPDNRINRKLKHGTLVLVSTFGTIWHDAPKVSVLCLIFHFFWLERNDAWAKER